ncbi:hypothetical protein PC39_15829 [Salinisphaera sp. PC39]|uniref:hypothetical protein n=1 Tax=Salinisphaera sp. PC39 TaxID=1304156 RepID=UPI00333F7822
MTLQEFQTLLDTRGPDPAAWGVAQRLRTRRLLRRSAEARRRLAAARALAHGFETLQTETVAPARLRARLRAIPATHPRTVPDTAAIPGLPARWWTAGAALGLSCFLAGMAMGAVWLDDGPEVDLATVVYAQVTSEEDWQ